MTGNEKTENKLTGIFADPEMQNPGTCSITDPLKLNSENLAAFSLKSGSLLINRGMNLKKLFNLDQGTKDIGGTPIPQNNSYDIGAMEHKE